MKNSFIALIIIMMFSCGGQKKSDKSSSQTIISSQTPYTINFSDSLNSVSLVATLDSLGDHREFKISLTQGDSLVISIIKESATDNIRINRIIDPYGASDGPFGSQAGYKITKTGVWSFIIGESLMVGEEFKGRFIIEVSRK